MLKCSNLMYCFEFDGTIVDNVPYFDNILIRNFGVFKCKKIFDPKKYDIRWSIITGRPSIDKCGIFLYCLTHGLNPCEIITYNKMLHHFTLTDYVAEYKLNVFKSILDSKRKCKYTNNPINRIIHVCNDQQENYLINSNKNGYEIISVNIFDFEREFFNHIV